MKTFTMLGLALTASINLFAQASGNINYLGNVRYTANNISVNPYSKDIVITVKGLANVKAESYVAIFNITQTGTNIEEVNTMAESRIADIRKKFEGVADMEFFTDMVSFVPVYEYESEKKLFSKRTYNEIPKGFELKMNLHVKYVNPELLNKVVSACSQSEVYDLIRVDYFSSQLDKIKKDMSVKAQLMVKEKMKMYQDLLGNDFASNRKQMADGYQMVYPLEMYHSYQAYASSSLNLKKPASGEVTQTDKSVTLYYQPVVNKEFDFVVNAEIVEPVIQVMYDLTFVIFIPEEKPQPERIVEKPAKEIYIVTPNGDLRNLGLAN